MSWAGARLGTAARRVAREASAPLLAAQLIGAGSAFVANLLAARVLEPSGRGELALLLQIAYFGTLGIVLGTDRSVVALYPGAAPRVVASAFARLLAWPSVITLMCAAAVLSLPLPPLEGWRGPLALAAVFMVINSFARGARSIAIAAGRTWSFLWFEVVTDVLLLAQIGWLTVQAGHSSAGWMASYLVAGVIPTVGWFLWCAHRRAEPYPVAGDAGPSRRSRARREGLQLLPATIAHNGTLRLDRLVLVGLASTEALGLYAAVATMTELIAWPLMAYADSRLGVWRQAHDRGRLSLRPVLVGALCYGLVAGVFAAVAVRLLMVPLLGERYAPALPLVIPLVIAAVATGISQLLITALTAVHRGRLSSAVEVVGLVVSVVSYVVLIGQFGALGAAYGSLIGYTTCLVLAGVLLARIRASSRMPGHVAAAREGAPL